MLNSLLHKMSYLRLFRFSFFLLLISCSAGRNSFDKIEQHLQESPVFKNSFAGLAVYDPEQRKMIYTHNGKKYFTPASNIKLLTFFAAVNSLEDTVSGLLYKLANDSLVFKGTGDPSFLNPDFSSAQTYEFLQQAPQQLFYLPPSKSISGLGPGWAWDDYNYGFSAEKSAFPVYGNQVTFRFIPGKEEPVARPAVFQDALVRSDQELSRIKRAPLKNIFYYWNPQMNKDTEQRVPFITSPELLVKILSDTLGREVRMLNSEPDGLLTTRFKSIATDSLYKKMLRESDNFVAEQLLLQVSGKLGDTLDSRKAIHHIKRNYLSDLENEPIWVDGSGLSRYNLLTPENLVKLLEKLYNDLSYKKLRLLLPVGGSSGTLKNQFQDQDAFVVAKTGSMSNNYSLSGFLTTKKGKILIFSFMNTNFVVPPPVLKAAVEKILLTIRNSY